MVKKDENEIISWKGEGMSDKLKDNNKMWQWIYDSTPIFLEPIYILDVKENMKKK